MIAVTPWPVPLAGWAVARTDGARSLRSPGPAPRVQGSPRLRDAARDGPALPLPPPLQGVGQRRWRPTPAVRQKRMMPLLEERLRWAAKWAEDAVRTSRPASAFGASDVALQLLGEEGAQLAQQPRWVGVVVACTASEANRFEANRSCGASVRTMSSPVRDESTAARRGLASAGGCRSDLVQEPEEGKAHSGRPLEPQHSAAATRDASPSGARQIYDLSLWQHGDEAMAGRPLLARTNEPQLAIGANRGNLRRSYEWSDRR
jgi:hypothetical protein